MSLGIYLPARQHLLPVLLSLLCRWLHRAGSEWCEEGRYKPSQGSEACSSCPANTLSQTGSDELTDCRCNSGYTGSDGGPCLACAPGKHKTGLGSSACSDCEAGKFSNAVAANSCENCPANSNSVAGSDAAQDCACAPGFTGVCECGVCVCVCVDVCVCGVCIVLRVYACTRTRVNVYVVCVCVCVCVFSLCVRVCIFLCV